MPACSTRVTCCVPFGACSAFGCDGNAEPENCAAEPTAAGNCIRGDSELTARAMPGRNELLTLMMRPSRFTLICSCAL